MRSPFKFLALGLALTFSTSAMADSLSTSGDPSLLPRGQQPMGVACGPFVLNQSTAQTVVAGSTISCNGGGPGFLHTDNSYFRAFSLGAFPTGFSACGVRLGVETANAAGVGTTQPLTVRIYSNTGGAFPAGTRTQVGTATVNVADQALTLLDVPVSGTVPAGAELIAEVFTPSGQVDGHSLFVGSNAAGQSGPGYIQASSCGIGSPTSLATIGFPNVHLVLSVLGGAPGTADLSIVMTDAPDPVTAGTNLNYTVAMTNTGPDAAQNARFTVPLPAGTTLVSTTPSAGGVCTAVSPIVCTWAGATASAAVRTAAIVATVAADTADGAFLNSSATATSDTTDADPADNLSTVSTAVVTAANLSMALTDAPDPVNAGTNLTYTATLSQGGPSDAQNARFSVIIPVETSWVSATASAGGVCAGTTTVTCTWAGATATGVNRSATIVVSVPANTNNGASLTAEASATSDTVDPTPGNNVANAATAVIASADLSLTLTDAPDPVVAGAQLTYTATVGNAGPSDASAVAVTLPTPANTSFVSGSVTGGGACSGSPVVCTVAGSIAPGGARTVTIVMLVAASAPEGSVISATATATAGSSDPNPGNNSATTTTAVIARADLQISFGASVPQVLINIPVTFTATSLNLGPSDAQDVSVTITLTPDFRYAGHTATGATCTTPQVGNTGAIVCTWAGASIPGATRTLVVTAFSNNEGPTGVSASTTSATVDPVTTNNSANLSVQVGYLVEEIPSLSGLGLMLMGLLFGLIGFVAVRRQA